MSLPLVLVQPGEKLPSLADVPGDFSDWILAGMGWGAARVTVLRPQQGDGLPPPRQVAAVIVTGSSAMVTERVPWMLATEAWLRELVALQRPVLGICFGHQLLAQALGGRVADNPNGIEVGTVTTRLTMAGSQDALFSGWPAAAPVQASHQQSVLTLPPSAEALAASEQDPHHAFRIGSCAWGVQFHPEFDSRIVAAYEDYYAPRLAAGYLSACRQARQESPSGNAILGRFAGLCR